LPFVANVAVNRGGIGLAKRRLAIARLWYEANSFSPLRTNLAAFQAREWVSGEEARRFYAGTATEIGGVLASSPIIRTGSSTICTAPRRRRAGWSAGCLHRISQRIWPAPTNEMDAVYLSLHARWRPSTTNAGASPAEVGPRMIGAAPLGAASDHLSAEMAALLVPPPAITPIRTSTWTRRRSARWRC
jgi:hypothetical protein